MQMIQCPNGHFYDASIYPRCPYCDGSAAGTSVGVTVPVQRPAQSSAPGATVAVIKKKLGIDPALMANPMISSLTDMFSTVVYMLIAAMFLGIAL